MSPPAKLEAAVEKYGFWWSNEMHHRLFWGAKNEGCQSVSFCKFSNKSFTFTNPEVYSCPGPRSLQRKVVCCWRYFYIVLSSFLGHRFLSFCGGIRRCSCWFWAKTEKYGKTGAAATAVKVHKRSCQKMF